YNFFTNLSSFMWLICNFLSLYVNMFFMHVFISTVSEIRFSCFFFNLNFFQNIYLLLL
ncbi:hypothetical protein L9F63_019518, partial [Diploptera punctata]